LVGNFAINADSISKRYSIGQRAPYKALRDKLANLLSSPFRKNVPVKTQLLWALKDVTFSIAEGERVGIIGRNGAGKSTLLKILSRITEPTSGEAQIRGRVNSLLEVGTGFHPELTGRENVYLNGSILGMRKAEIDRKFDEMVAFADVDKFIDTQVKFYSSGMFVRLAFSVAAHLEPEILLVDEVLAVGDAAFQKKCLGKMEGMTIQGRTVIFVSHNMAAVKSLCRRAIWIDSGSIVADGEPQSVITSYIGSTGADAADYEISEEKHVTGSSKVRVRRVRLLDSHEAGTFTVFWNQPIQLALEFEVRKPIKDASFGVGVVTTNGVPLLTVHHNDNDGQLMSLDCGVYIMHVTLQNPLRAGTYRFVFGAHEGLAKSSIFYIPDAVQFEVLDVGQGTEHYIHHNEGLINGNATWRLASHSTQPAL
jgi:lipopolysaccharide transport system ATP-binding protein